MDLSKASNKIAEQGELVNRIRDEVGKVIVGQEKLIDRLILALVANGHILARRERAHPPRGRAGTREDAERQHPRQDARA